LLLSGDTLIWLCPVHSGQGLTSGKHTCSCYPALAWHDAASGAQCPSPRPSGGSVCVCGTWCYVWRC